MRTRRSFLGLGAGALVAVALPLPALAADEGWVVTYLWSRTLSRVVAHRKAVADALGPEIGALLVVRGNTNAQWGLVDETASADQKAVREIAAARNRHLQRILGGDDLLAAAMPAGDFARTHHVGYGALPTEADGRARFDLVARMLGPEVHAAMALEATDGEWQPIYRRYGDETTTAAIAAKHAKILAPRKIPTEVVADRYVDPRPIAVVVAAAEPPPEPAAKPAAEPPPKVAAEAAPPKVEAPPKAIEPAVVREESPPPKAAGSPLDLPATSDTDLRDTINEHVQGLRKRGLVAADETTSWYVQTLHDDRTWAAINAERSLQCASMVKPYVALAFFHRVQEGRIIYGPASRTKLEAMIGASSNTATNWAMDTLGGAASVQRILAQHYGHLLPETEIVEEIPRGGRTYKNRSSARDYVRFSRALWRDELPGSAELKRLMTLPGRDRLYTGAPSIPKCTEVMNKTGTTAQLCGDFGILVARTVDGKKIPYAIVGIIEKSCSVSSYTSWVASRTQVIRGVSNLTYQALKKQYRLV